MRLEQLKLKNFLTYEELEYEFQQGSSVLVQGRNLTDKGQESNGSGKSGIQTAIEYCIAGSNSRDVRDVELITYGQKQAMAELIASCDMRKEFIKIKWTLKAKGSNVLELSKKDYGSDSEWSVISFSNVNDGKKYVLDWFALTKEDLFSYFIINKSRFKSFFKSSNREKIQLINRFSDASIIDNIEKVDMTDLEEEGERIELELARVEGKLELSQESLEEEKSVDIETMKEHINIDFDSEIEGYEDDIEQFEETLNTASHTFDTIRQEIDDLKKTLDERRKDLSKASLEKYDTSTIDRLTKSIEAMKLSLDTFIKNEKADWSSKKADLKVSEKAIYEKVDIIESDIDHRESQMQKVQDSITKINSQLSGMIVCPNCSFKFDPAGEFSKDELEEKQEKLKAFIEPLQNAIKEYNKKLHTFEMRLDELHTSMSALRIDEAKEFERIHAEKESILRFEEELRIEKQRMHDFNNRTSTLENLVSLAQSDVKMSEVEEKQIVSAVKSCKDKIIQLKVDIMDAQNRRVVALNNIKGVDQKAIKQIEKTIKELKNTEESLKQDKLKNSDAIYERNQWINILKQFRIHIANKSLDLINYHCNRYLTDMESDLRVKFEGYKILASGSIKDEITAKVIRDGEYSYSSFSGGERGRLLFSSILANRHMINSLHPYGGLDFLSIDEVFEGVDGMGLKYLIKSAKKLNVTCMIITHVSSEIINDDILLIEKVNGISKISK